jgi:DNA-binding IscR family transcriptional regulator
LKGLPVDADPNKEFIKISGVSPRNPQQKCRRKARSCALRHVTPDALDAFEQILKHLIVAQQLAVHRQISDDLGQFTGES